MRSKILHLLVPVIFLCVASSSYSQDANTIKEERISVGFHCPQGKAFVEKGLKNTAGVTEVIADLETKVVYIKFVEGQTNREQLVATIEQLGYVCEDSKSGTTNRKPCANESRQETPAPVK